MNGNVQCKLKAVLHMATVWAVASGNANSATLSQIKENQACTF
jgi:hypothetical protein